MNFAKYFLTISTLLLNLALQGPLHAAANGGAGGGYEEGVAEYKPAAAHDPTGTSAPVLSLIHI